VQLKLSKKTVILDEVQIEKVDTFLNYTFTNVLRLQKYLMLFDPNASENSYIIVPVKICKYKRVLKKQNDVNPNSLFIKMKPITAFNEIMNIFT